MTLAGLVAAETTARAQQAAAAEGPLAEDSTQINFEVRPCWSEEEERSFLEDLEGVQDEAMRRELLEEHLQPTTMRIADLGFEQGLIGADEVIIPEEQSIEVELDYPLSHPVVFSCRTDNPAGFTRLHVARFVQETYFRIYEEEEMQAGQPGNIPGMYNRASTDGPYGIWGHDISDLAFEGLSCSGPGRYCLWIGS